MLSTGEAMMAANKNALDRAAERRHSLVDDAYGELKRAIRDSEYPPGYHASTQELALRLGMSRTPIHEAALKLQQEGLVRILPKRGIVICALAPDDIREIYEVIIAIEGGAAERAAGLPRKGRLPLAAALTAETDRMERALEEGNLARWGKADEAFHRLLVEGCGNRRLAIIMQTVNDQSHRARMMTLRLRRRLSASIAEHHAIAGAIREGAPQAAHEAARGHRKRARDELLPLIEEMGLRHL